MPPKLLLKGEKANVSVPLLPFVACLFLLFFGSLTLFPSSANGADTQEWTLDAPDVPYSQYSFNYVPELIQPCRLGAPQILKASTLIGKPNDLVNFHANNVSLNGCFRRLSLMGIKNSLSLRFEGESNQIQFAVPQRSAGIVFLVLDTISGSTMIPLQILSSLEPSIFSSEEEPSADNLRTIQVTLRSTRGPVQEQPILAKDRHGGFIYGLTYEDMLLYPEKYTFHIDLNDKGKDLCRSILDHPKPYTVQKETTTRQFVKFNCGALPR